MSFPFFLAIFVVAAVLGSFLEVCILRIPRGESIIDQPSICSGCKTAIPLYDNIQFISYIVLRGAVVSVAKGFTPRYFFVELLMASLAVILFYRFALGLVLAVGFIFVAALNVIYSPNCHAVDTTQDNCCRR